jgi:NAD dependent epimerase/dehydratase family enzyme
VLLPAGNDYPLLLSMFTVCICVLLSPAGNDYLAEICREWEAAAQGVPPSTRVVIIRTGLVLAREGGVLGKMMPIFELFAGRLG